ncbi:LysM peptidoglycan-binding domain-containing protein [Waltera sp.]|uniref:LysM peptidoglycan-binding domain-containing protein n=1 Tax=Waltera sp. TaxID=2815806 RepID=UPI00307BB3CA
MKKRLLSVVLAFTLCFGMMPVTVLAEEMGNAETVALALDDQVVVRAVNSTHEEDAVGDTVSGDSIIPGGVSATSLMSNDGITVVADDATGTVVAKLGDQNYTDMATALEDWQENGGMLALQGQNASYNISTVTWSFQNAPGTLDLNGVCISGSITLSGSSQYPLTILDSKEKVSSNGALLGLTVEKGAKLTLTDGGYISPLTVEDGAEDGIQLMGGKVAELTCKAPVYHLLPEGYALMNGNLTVDPTTVINERTAAFMVKDAQITKVTGDRTGSVAYGEHKIPFAISVTTNDSKIGRMAFEWYLVKENGTTAPLAMSGDTWSRNGAYSYDVTIDGSANEGWKDLEINKPYNIICVSIGKEKDGAYQWQTPLKGFQLTITPAGLNSKNTNVEITNANNLVYTGNPLTAAVKVTYNGTELTEGQDYTVSSNTGTAGKTGSVTITDWNIDTDTGKVTYTLEGGAAGDTVTLPVTVTSANYETTTVNVKITLTDKETQAALAVTGGTTVEYGQTLQLGINGGSGTGNVTYTVTNGDGQAGIDATGRLIPTKVGTVIVTATKAGDDDYNAITSGPVTITITKAASTGTPGYTGITTDGQTLRDADLRISGGSLHPTAGRLEWIDDAGNVLPDTTVVEANRTYLWRYTPEDTNYVPLTGSVVLYPVSNRGDISDVPDTPSYTPTPAVPDTGDSSSDDDDDDDTPAVSNSSNSTTARQPSAGPATLDYAIKRGDTLGAIARKYGCTVAELVAANSDLIKNPNRIHIGWKLKIPQHQTTGTMVAPTDNNNSDAYIIKLGDTLWAIARRYGCTVADIVKMNSNLITMPDRIRVGWQLNMPVK